MNERRDSFTTSFGRVIGFTPGHIEFTERTAGLPVETGRDWSEASINTAKGHENIDYEKVNERLKEKERFVTLNRYATRFARVYLFMELAGNAGIRFPFKKCLDVGCGHAIQPRIMKGLGLVQESAGIDIYDRASSVEEGHLAKLHRRMWRFKLLEPVYERLLKIPPRERKEWHWTFLKRFNCPRITSIRYNGWAHSSDFYRQRMAAPPALDRLIIGDIFDQKEKYDLITSFASLEWFESGPIMKKISELLETGGVFYMTVPNWWCPFNSTLHGGHFPYAAQRLTKEDFFRYLDECLPGHSSAMKVAYGYFDPTHPTLSDYIDIGHRYGMAAVAHYSHILPEPFYMKYGISSLGYFGHDNDCIDEVLEDIHRFRPDVRRGDLLGKRHTIIFKKIDKKAVLTKKMLEDVYQDLRKQRQRTAGPFMRSAYKLYKRYTKKEQ